MNIKGLVYCPSYEHVYDNLQDAIWFIGNVANDEKDAIGWSINVCEKIQPKHNSFMNAKDLINEMQNRAYEEHSEWSEDYLSDVEFDDEKIKSLNLLLEKWFDENASQPTFYRAGKDVKTIVVDKNLLNEYGVEF
jgi:hypothetical protein